MSSYLVSLLYKNYQSLKVEKDFPTRKISFLKTGGNVQLLVYPESIQQLSSLTQFFLERGIEFVVLGKCSNVLFSDKPMSLVIIKTDRLGNITITDERVYAECGVGLSHLALECGRHSLGGLEFLFGIPGSLGGGVAMNAGAYGKNLSDKIDRVYMGGSKIAVISNDDCGFDYRSSRFLEDKEIILAAEFCLKRTDCAEIDANLSAITLSRKNSQPSGLTLGSTFKNPNGAYAGELIEKAGLKGFGIGGAAISKKHCNFIINSGSATSADVKKLIEYIKVQVFKQFNIVLEEEIQYIGEV